jgi:hypothetical protein
MHGFSSLFSHLLIVRTRAEEDEKPSVEWSPPPDSRSVYNEIAEYLDFGWKNSRSFSFDPGAASDRRLINRWEQQVTESHRRER